MDMEWQFDITQDEYAARTLADLATVLYSDGIRWVGLVDHAQDGDIIAFVPETQVDSLLAHLNG
jgi:hypothetical protein